MKMQKIMKIIYPFFVKLTLAPSYLVDKFFSLFWKGCMSSCGKGVYLRPLSSDIKGLYNLSIGDYTSIPKRATFYCTRAPLSIGKKVILGPNPTIITGDHRTDVIGKFLIDVTDDEKLPENDVQVV